MKNPLFHRLSEFIIAQFAVFFNIKMLVAIAKSYLTSYFLPFTFYIKSPKHGLFLLCLVHKSAAEEQGDAPDGGESDEGVDNAADGGGLSAENVGHKVESEKTHETPVESADYGEDKGDAIHKHVFFRSFGFWIRP